MDIKEDMSNMWKTGSWSSMEELLLSNQFSPNEKIGLLNQEILGDENQTILEGLNRLDGLLDEFLAASKSEDEAEPAFNSLDNEEFFPEWVENKIDFSLLENLDNLDKLLDDPALVMQDECNKLSTDEVTTTVKCPSVKKLSKEMDFSFKDTPNSPLYLHPSSPEGIVPNISAPTSPIASSPPSFGNIILSNNIYPSPLPSPSFTTSPTSFTIILPSGNLTELVANYQEVAEVQLLPETLNGDLNNLGIDLPLEAQKDLLPIAEESAINSFEGILKNKPAIKQEVLVKVKSGRGRKRKNVEDFIATSPNSSDFEEYTPTVPKQRKERKRMQNKDAATRYRQKKKAEAEAIGEVEEKLLDENKSLKDKAQQLSNEISYLKGLMREMFKAQGLLK